MAVWAQAVAPANASGTAVDPVDPLTKHRSLLDLQTRPGILCRRAGPKDNQTDSSPIPRSDRLIFRNMTDDDLEDMAAMLADPAVMKFYPRPKTVMGPRLGSTGTRATTSNTATVF